MPVALDTEYVPATNEVPVSPLVSVATACETGCGLWPAHAPGLGEYVAGCYDAGIILANAPSDTFVLLRAFPQILPHVIAAYEGDRVFDVLTREKLIDIAEGMHFQRGQYNLGAVADRRAGVFVDKADEWRMRYGELLGLEVQDWPEGARRYAVADAAATFAVYVAQEQLRNAHSIDVFADAGRQARGHLPLYTQTLRGIRTDQEQVDRVDSRLTSEITQHNLHCLKHGLVRVGGSKKAPKFVGDKKAAAAMMVEHCRATGLKVAMTAPSTKFPEGQVKLDESTLGAVQLPEGHPLDAFRLRLALQSTRTKNVSVLRKPLIRCRYDELAASGRTTSSGPQGRRKLEVVEDWEWVGTNLQNQNRKGGFRECLVPPPGHLFVISDWSGAELVALAQVQIDLFGSSALGEMLREGRDPHSEFGARMLGIPIADFDRHGNKEHAEARQGAKAWNFGKPGRMGQKRFIQYAWDDYGVRVAPAQEREFTREWHAMLPEVQMLFDYVDSLQGVDDKITIIQPRSHRIRGGLYAPDACNTHFQGLAADAAKDAMWRLWRAGLDPALPLFVGGLIQPSGKLSDAGEVLFVHDENVRAVLKGETHQCEACGGARGQKCSTCYGLGYRSPRAEAARDEQERIMIEAFGAWCPDVPIKVESSITERYTK